MASCSCGGVGVGVWVGVGVCIIYVCMYKISVKMAAPWGSLTLLSY